MREKNYTAISTKSSTGLDVVTFLRTIDFFAHHKDNFDRVRSPMRLPHGLLKCTNNVHRENLS